MHLLTLTLALALALAMMTGLTRLASPAKPCAAVTTNSAVDKAPRQRLCWRYLLHPVCDSRAIAICVHLWSLCLHPSLRQAYQPRTFPASNIFSSSPSALHIVLNLLRIYSLAFSARSHPFGRERRTFAGNMTPRGRPDITACGVFLIARLLSDKTSHLLASRAGMSADPSSCGPWSVQDQGHCA